MKRQQARRLRDPLAEYVDEVLYVEPRQKPTFLNEPWVQVAVVLLIVAGIVGGAWVLIALGVKP